MKYKIFEGAAAMEEAEENLNLDHVWYCMVAEFEQKPCVSMVNGQSNVSVHALICQQYCGFSSTL